MFAAVHVLEMTTTQNDRENIPFCMTLNVDAAVVHSEDRRYTKT